MSYYKKSVINILGINIFLDNKDEVEKKIYDFIESDKPNYIVTPNPEIILCAQNDPKYMKILNKADIAIADGFGVKLAGLTLNKNVPRITGADLLVDLLKIAENTYSKVAVLNWNKSLSRINDIENSIKNKYPGLNFKVFESDRKVNTNTISNIKKYSPQIILVTLGAPYQEKFIYNNLNNFTSAKLSIGIGGAFDFFTNRLKRAPKFLRYIGLEWFFRIFQEKGKRKLWRLKRIYRAVVVFSFTFIKWRFRKI